MRFGQPAFCDHVFGGRLIDQRNDLVLHGRDPIGDLDPLGAVPLLHIGRVVAVVVVAGDLHRRREVSKPISFHRAAVMLQRFQTAAHFITGDVLLAGDLLRVADAFGDHRSIHYAAIVEVLADLILRRLAVALVDHVLDDVLDRREVRAHGVEVERQIAFAAGTCRTRIVFAARPPDTDEVIHRIAGLGGFLHGRRVHRTPAPHDHVVGLVAANAEPET